MPTDAISEGVSMATYAAVKAATAEGFALADVLACEGLSAQAWMEADAALKVELTREPAALSAYTAELAAAEDWLARRVTPLDNDPDAWVAFLHAFSTSPEPFALLETNGLGMNDLSRLRRRWAKRVEEESGLEDDLAERARSPRALTQIHAEPAVLRRSRGAEETEAPVSAEAPPSSSIAARRALDAHRGALQAITARRAAIEPEASPKPVIAGVAPIASGSPALPPDMRGFIEIRDAQPNPEAAPAVSPGIIPAGMRGFLDVYGTMTTTDAPAAGPVLPFTPGAPSSLPASGAADDAGAKAMASLVPEGMRQFTSLTGTEAAPEAPPKPATPFAARPEIPAGMRGFRDVHGTQAADDNPPAGPALPFEPSAPPRPNAAPPAAQSLPSPGPSAKIPAPSPIEALVPEGMRHFKSLTGTEILPAETQGPARPSPAVAPLKAPGPTAAPVGIPKGMQRFVNVEGTQAPPAEPARPALPFASAEVSAPPPKPSPAPMAPAPRLTLEQYTCMCVELALYPTYRLEVLRRYGVDEKQQPWLDGYWGARVRDDPSAKAAWDRYYAEHWTRLRGPRGGHR